MILDNVIYLGVYNPNRNKIIHKLERVSMEIGLFRTFQKQGFKNAPEPNRVVGESLQVPFYFLFSPLGHKGSPLRV